MGSLAGCSLTPSLIVSEDTGLAAAREQLERTVTEIPSIYLVKCAPLEELEEDSFEALMYWVEREVRAHKECTQIHNGLVDVLEARRK